MTAAKTCTKGLPEPAQVGGDLTKEMGGFFYNSELCPLACREPLRWPLEGGESVIFDLESAELQTHQQAITRAPGVISCWQNCLKPLTPFAGENCSCSIVHSESQIRRSCDPF
jgi:hypothetical protein